jgi:uncharacterized membrane protein
MMCAVFFGSAALLARAAPMPYPIMALLIGSGTAFATLMWYALVGGNANEIVVTISQPKGLLMIVAGIVNGIGLVLFYRLIEQAQNGSAEMSRMIPIVLAMMPLIISIGAVMFFKESFTFEKISGTVLVLAGVYVLNK